MNGFDRYLDFQYRRSGDFFSALFQAIALADRKNTAALSEGYPEEVEAYRVWSREGVQAYLDHVSKDYPLRDRFVEDYNLYDGPSVIVDSWKEFYMEGNFIKKIPLTEEMVEDYCVMMDAPVPWVPLVFLAEVSAAGFELRSWKRFTDPQIIIEVNVPGPNDVDVPQSLLQEVIGRVMAGEAAEVERRKRRVTKS